MENHITSAFLTIFMCSADLPHVKIKEGFALISGKEEIFESHQR